MADHGTTARYESGCHCPTCTEAARKAQARRELLKATGRWQPFTNPDPVRAHLQALAAAGLTRNDIARATHTPIDTLDHIRRGHYTQVRTETARRILAVNPNHATTNRFVIDATGTRRRLQALYWRGYSTEALCRATGIPDRNLRAITRGSATHITRETRDAATAAYRRLADTDPAEIGVPADAAERALAFARRRGWAPAAAWDDDTIDDPNATPDLGAQTRRRDAIAEDAAFIAKTTGADRDLIAARLGITRTYLDRSLERAKAAA